MMLVCNHAATLPSKDNRFLSNLSRCTCSYSPRSAYQTLSFPNAEVLWSRIFGLGISETAMLGETCSSFLSWSHSLLV